MPTNDRLPSPSANHAKTSDLEQATDTDKLPAQEILGQPRDPDKSFFATICLLSVMVFVFIFELMLAMASYSDPVLVRRPWDFDVELLTKLGAFSGRLVLGEGEWWRLLVAPFLHASPAHVLLNGVALIIVGPRLEGLIGPAWYVAVFSVSCISGELCSVLINSSSIVSVGASGGIMGLFASAVAVSFRLGSAPSLRTNLRLDALRMLIPALVPALLIPVMGGSQAGIDVAAHLGGAVGGMGLGLFLVSRPTELEGLRAPISSR